MTYQPESDTWIADRNTVCATVCEVTGEYFDPYYTTYRTIDGEACCVWAGVDMGARGYSYLDHRIGYTLNEDEYTYDDVTDRYYTNDEYEELVAERASVEEESEDDEDSNTIAA